MYNFILSIHSITRWLVLASLIFTIYKAYSGWRSGKQFSSFDNTIRHTTATIAQIQMMLGMWLYFISPLVKYFLTDVKTAIHIRETRFFGMEHSSMMFISVVLISIGSAAAKRKERDEDKFKTITIWFGIALIIILANIPWAFSPLTARPYWRGF